MSARCFPAVVRVRCTLLWLLLPGLGLGAEGRLRVQYFNVGQGDAALITCPDGTHHMLIDSGDNKYPGSQDNLQADLAKYLGPAGTRLDFAVASHPHSDHIGGMAWVLTNYQVGTYIDNGRPAETTTWSRINDIRRKKLKSGEMEYINGKEDSLMTLKLCDKVTFTLITPSAGVAKLTDPNDQSVGVRMDYKGRSFLFVGDMEDHAEAAWLNQLTPAARSLIDVDVLKVGHHGSDTSSTMAFIQAVSPDLAVVSCGKRLVSTNIRYKHPRASTVQSYADWFKIHPPAVTAETATVWAYNKPTAKWITVPRPAGLWLTVNDGTVTVETDGSHFFVTESH